MPPRVAEVNVTGYAELRRALSRLSPELVPELRDAMKDAANEVAVEASRRLTNAVAANQTVREKRSTGRSAASIRATSSGTIIYLNAGRKTVPYYGWLDFGGDLKPTGGRHNKQSRPFLKRGRFLYPAIDAKSGAAIKKAERAFDNATRKAGLN